jgi:hypothetical protein
MALVLKDRVKETSTTTGTGTFTLAGASTGFQSFSVIGNGNTTFYTIALQGGNEWEVGVGTYTSSGTTLARNTVIESSNGGTLVNFSAGTKDVFVTQPAERTVYDSTGSTGGTDAVSTKTANSVVRRDASGNFAAGIITADTIAIKTNTTDAIFVKDDNLTAWDYSGKSFSVNAQETVPTGLFFSPDGIRMYVIGSTGDDVNQYSLSTAWDVTTASFVRVSALIGETLPTGVSFKPDGTAMFITGSTNDTVREFSLSTAWDVSTITFVQSFSVAAQDTVPQDIWFREDGLKMYMVGSTSDRVNEYDLGTAWNISTLSFVQFFSVAPQEITPVAVNLSSDGLKMYVLGATGLDINRYSLSTAWDISTATFFNNFYVGFQETAPTGMFINLDDDVAYVVGSTADTVFQYDTLTDGIELTSQSGLFLDGSLYTNKNLVVTSNSRIDGTLRVAGAVVGASFTGAVAASTLSASSTLTLGSATTSANVIGTTVTTGSTTVGGTNQTGLLVFGQSTNTSTTEVSKGATLSGNTKTVNIGTGGVSGSTTNINIGSDVSGATSTTTVNGVFTTPVPQASNGLVVNSNTISTSYSIPSGSSASSVGPITVASGQTVTVPSGSRWVVL